MQEPCLDVNAQSARHRFVCAPALCGLHQPWENPHLYAYTLNKFYFLLLWSQGKEI